MGSPTRDDLTIATTKVVATVVTEVAAEMGTRTLPTVGPALDQISRMEVTVQATVTTLTILVPKAALVTLDTQHLRQTPPVLTLIIAQQQQPHLRLRTAFSQLRLVPLLPLDLPHLRGMDKQQVLQPIPLFQEWRIRAFSSRAMQHNPHR